MSELTDSIQTFFTDHWTQLLWILVLLLFAKLLLSQLVNRVVTGIMARGTEENDKKRRQAKTIGQVTAATGNVIIYTIVLLMVLDLLNIDVTPILAGAGVLGLIIGFGSQELVRDFVSGMFIILEQQYGVGDKIKVGDVEGEVVKVSLRSTVVQDKDKHFVYLTNGSINKVVNLTQEKQPR